MTIQLNSYTFKRKEVIEKYSHIELIDSYIIDHIKEYEQFKSKPYKLGGFWLIGYGHLITKNEKFTTITEEEATRLLMKDLLNNIKINRVVVKYSNFNQLLAISLLTYNVGVGKFQSYKLFDSINENKDCSIWLNYCYFNNKKHKKLLERRKFEYELFKN